MKQQRKSRWPNLFRDLFLGTLALVILYDQVFVVAASGKAVQPILIFLVIFLFGSIPALRGNDKRNQPSTFARVVMALMGVSLPTNYEENEEDPDIGTSSSGAGRTRHHTASAEHSLPPSSGSSKLSPAKKNDHE
jgi:hypothetical protein